VKQTRAAFLLRPGILHFLPHAPLPLIPPRFVLLLPLYGSNSKLSGYAKKSTDHFGEQMELISGDLKDPRISGDIEKEVKEILDALGPRLPQVQKDPRNIGELAELYDVRRARRQPRALAPVKIDEAGCVEKVEAELLEPGA
jgi:hypothetical protein